MHKRKYYLLLLLGFLIFSSVLPAKNNNAQKANLSFSKTSALDPTGTLSNINNWSYWLYNDGISGINYQGQQGGIYPRGTAGTIFQDGLIWGTRVNGNIRVGGQTYSTGTQALLDRIYRIRADWAILTLGLVLEETAEFYDIEPVAVTSDQAIEIIEQYKKDWKEWPVDQGAPYVDVDHSGTYNPVLDNNGMPDINQGDYPGIEGADQVVWFKVDDQDPVKTASLYGSEPIGVEMDVTVWAYNQRSSKLGQAIFKKYKLKNISTDVFDEMYLSQWSDPDLGDSSNDLVGCDSISSTAFVYNGFPDDVNFSYYGIVPPAVGYALLQGPVVPSPGDTAFFNSLELFDYKNLLMTSFVYFGAGNPEWGDPIMQDYDGTLEWYNLLRGNISKTDTDNPVSFTHRNTGQETNFPLNGDPVSGTGDVGGDGANFPPADRRMAFNSGPFILNPGETQEMVVALVGGVGENYLNSITVMKENIEEIKGQYGKPILVPKASYSTSHPNNSTTELVFTVDLTAYDSVTNCYIALKSDFVVGETGFYLFDDGSNNDNLAGDNIWTAVLSGLNQKYPYSGTLKVHFDEDELVFGNIFESIRVRPLPELKNWRVVWENAIQDSKINNNEKVHLQFDITNNNSVNDIDVLKISKQRSYTFNSGLTSGSTIESDSLYFVVEGSSSKDSITFFYKIEFDNHSELVSSTLPVTSWNPHHAWGDTLSVQSITGLTNNVFPVVADPSLTTDHTYRIKFSNDDFSGDLLWRLVDVTNGQTKIADRKVATSSDYPHPVVDGIQWQVTTPPLLVKDWTYSGGNVSPLYPDYNLGRWISGNDWGGSALFGGLGMAHIFWGEDPGVSPADFPITEIRFTHMTSYDDTDGDGSYTFDADGGEPYSFNVAEGQKAFMYQGWGGGTFSGFNDVPFQVWDVNDPESPRQLNVIVRDRDQNGQWDLNTGDGPYNYIWIMSDDYDPSGQAWDGSTPEKDFMGQIFSGPIPAFYTLWATQRGTRPMLAESGVLTVIPYLHNAPGDELEIVSTVLGIDDAKVPLTYYMHQNYPNPFNPTTQIKFGLQKKSKVRLEIFNILGQKVKTLINTSLAAGAHTAFWDGKNEVGKLTATGLYFYRLSADKFVKTKKMILIR